MKSRSSFRVPFAFLASAGLLSILLSYDTALAGGTWYVSTSGDDSNDCLSPAMPCATINTAIARANAGDTVYVELGTYVGAVTEVVRIDKDVALYGGWDASFTSQVGRSAIDGEGFRRGIDTSAGVSATVERFVVQNGNAAESDGGGINNQGTLTLRDSEVALNAAHSGGGISNFGTMTVINTRISQNRASGTLRTGGGGGIFNAGRLELFDSVVDGNTTAVYGGAICVGSGGGGIYNSGTMSVTRSDVSNNVAEVNQGGGIMNVGTLSIMASSVADNSANSVNSFYGGGIYSDGILEVFESTVSGNEGNYGGGGLWTSCGTVTIRNSTFSDNAARYNGGGLFINGSSVVIENSTISGNVAGDVGGGIGIYVGSAFVSNSTVTSNIAMHAQGLLAEGGGILAPNPHGVITLQNTIVAGNSNPRTPDCGGTVFSAGYNLIGNPSNCNFTPTTGDLTNLEPHLGPLQGNGGSTLTHALLGGSPALDAGNPTACTDQEGNPLASDQRGQPRTIDGDGDGNARCDIGALEVQGVPPTPTPGPSPTPAPSPTPTPIPTGEVPISVFMDPGGDSGSAPDITTVEVSFDPLADTYRFVVNVANQFFLAQESVIHVQFDVDQNSATGGGGGTDAFVVFLSDGRSFFQQWTGSTFETRSAPSLRASFRRGQLTVVIGASDLGTSAGFNFSISGLVTTPNVRDSDLAPDRFDKWIFFTQGPPKPGSAIIRGRVVDAETGQPLAGDAAPFASVNLRACPLASCRDFVAFQFVDTEGVFRITADRDGNPLTGGIYRLEASADLYPRTRFGPFQANGGQELDLGDIPLTAEPLANSVSGRVVDAVSGNPLPGDAAPFATAELRSCTGADCFTVAGPYPVGNDGSFQFDRSNSTLLLGTYEVLVRADGYVPFLSDRLVLVEDEAKALGDIALALLQPAGPWYVTTDGDDANSCATIDQPCASINGALAKAHFGDTIYVAFGVYTGPGNEVVLLNKNAVLSGGWDRATFTQQIGFSVIDGGDTRRGITNQFTATVDNFTIRNARVPVRGAGIYNSGDLTLMRSLVTGNNASVTGGIYNAGGTLTLVETHVLGNSGNGVESFQPFNPSDPTAFHEVTVVDSNLTRNGASGFQGVRASLVMTGGSISGNFGGGISIVGPLLLSDVIISENGNSTIGGGGIWKVNVGPTSLTNVTISGNTASEGGGIYFWGGGPDGMSLTNVTISGNTAASRGGGIMAPVFNPGEETVAISLSNSTLVDNSAVTGGGMFSERTVIFRNTIVAHNPGGNCDGANRVESAGYNLDSGSSCSFTSPGDQVNTNPLLRPLDINGGPTLTHALLPGSPAIDAGNPAGCVGQEGNALATDQRGAPRPIDGDGDGVAVCDIGAFELGPVIPGERWFVATTGDDRNDCLSPSTPCVSINGALGKARPGDTILVASGTFTGIEPVIVEINQNAILSGGWNASFDQQNDFSIIDGEFLRRGISIFAFGAARIERFIVQNGSSSFRGGGIMNLGTLTLDQSIIVGNSASSQGGGIFNTGTLTLNHSTVGGNRASAGTGIFNDGGTLRLSNTAVRVNSGNGIESFSASLTHRVSLTNSDVLNNAGRGIRGTNTDLQVTGGSISGNSDGGIFNIGPTTLTNVTVSNNETATDGAGIYLTNIVTASLTNVTISGNSAQGSGGGLYFWGLTGGVINLTDVIISGNSAGVNGGGVIVDSGTLSTMNLENTIVAGNVADGDFGELGSGGGIFSRGTLTLNNSTVRNNTAANGGGIGTTGVLTLQRSTVSNNHAASTGPDITSGKGGGIWNLDGIVTISNSTISDNSSSFVGGGIADDGGTTILNNSTISGNRGEGGGGIRSGLTLILSNATISNNRGGGVASDGGVTMRNSIIAGNSTEFFGFPDDCTGSVITSAGYNLIGNTSGCTLAPAAGDITNANPLLGPLQVNGGATLTHTSLPGSPAIDGGNPSGCSDQDGALLTTDQRGEPRPADGDGDGAAVCDIGAFESQDVLPAWFVNGVQGSDDNDCRSRASPCWTINAALVKAGRGDTVFVSTGTYSGIGSEVVLIQKDVILSGGWDLLFGSQVDRSIIDGQGARRGITVNEGVVVSMDRFWIRSGSSPSGAGIFNAGMLDLTRSEVSFNASGGGLAGGGIYNAGVLDLFRSLVAVNTGNGIVSVSGSLTVTSSTILENTGDGIFSEQGVLSVFGSTITGNSGTGIVDFNQAEPKSNEIADSRIERNGRAGILGQLSNLTVKRSTIINNASTGIAHVAGGTLVLTDSSIEGNGHSSSVTGGGIAATFTDLAILKNVTISGNSTPFSGGGIYFFGQLPGGVMNLTNVTISGNSAGMDGGGIIVDSGTSSTLNLNNVTITSNSADSDENGSGEGGGVYNNGVLNFRNTILFGNADPTSDPDCFGTLTSAGHNLIGVISSGCSVAGDTTGNLVGADPLLGRLEPNFGRTFTHALLAGSPAIDAGNPGGCTDHEGNALVTDQRGEPRPFDGDGDGEAICDIGAFEVQQVQPTPTPTPTFTATFTPTPTDTPTPIPTDTPTPTETPTTTPTFTPTSTPVTGPVCQGQPATVFVNREGEVVGGLLDGRRYEGRLIGTDGEDVIVGTAAKDRILARDGDDLVCGLAGNDRIFGGDGDDVLLGSDDDDRLLGGDGEDLLRGGEGDDALHGNADNDVLRGGNDDDALFGGEGNDQLFGGDDSDLLTGGAGADFFSGGSGIDTATDFKREKGDRKDRTIEIL